MKTCTKCKDNKDEINFSKKGSGLRPYCKTCASELGKKSKDELRNKTFTLEYIVNKLKIGDSKGIFYSPIQKEIVLKETSWMPEISSWKQRLYHVEYSISNIEKCKQCSTSNKLFMDYKFEYSEFCGKECTHSFNIERRKLYKKEHYEKNKIELIKKCSIRQKNNPLYNTYQNKYKKLYNKRKPHLIMWRNTLKNSLIRLNKKKEGKTIDLLGYSAIQLKEHLEKLFAPGMSWNNYGNGFNKWNIDHKKAVSNFETETHSTIVNALSNLQPMWSLENIKKGNK